MPSGRDYPSIRRMGRWPSIPDRPPGQAGWIDLPRTIHDNLRRKTRSPYPTLGSLRSRSMNREDDSHTTPLDETTTLQGRRLQAGVVARSCRRDRVAAMSTETLRITAAVPHRGLRRLREGSLTGGWGIPPQHVPRGCFYAVSN
jgi:hypothetical protein